MSTYDSPFDDNPFADMESSQFVSPTPQRAELSSNFTPSNTSTPDFDRQYRESAPEPETPFGQDYNQSYQSESTTQNYYATSPSPTPYDPPLEPEELSVPVQRKPAEIGDLLGNPIPILPSFQTTFKSSTGLSKNTQLEPVRMVNKRSLAGGAALAALLGFEESAEMEPAKAVKSEETEAVVPAPSVSAQETLPSVLESTATSLTPFTAPLPPSPPPEGPSATVSTISSASSHPSSLPLSSADYESNVSPMDSTIGGAENDLDHSEPTEVQLVQELEGLSVKAVESEKEKESIVIEPESRNRESTFESILPTTASPHLESPFQPKPQESTSTNFQSPFASDVSPNRGFRSYNYDDDMNSGGFDEGQNHAGFSSVLNEPKNDSNDIPTPETPIRVAAAESGSTHGSVTSVDHLATPSTSTFTISVGDPQKVGSSLNVTSQHTVYTVKTKTTSSSFRKPEFSVLRRFSHFLWLFDALTANNPGVIVPGMPEKSAMGRFGSDFVENRRLGLQVALIKIVSHPMLVGDPDLRLFLESDSLSNDIKQRKVDTPSEGTGFFASIGSSISGPKFTETDEYFDTRRHVLDAFESQLKALLLSLSNSAKLRHSLQTSIGELQSALLALSQCDLSTTLRSILEQSAAVQRKLRELSEAQSANEEEMGGLTSVAEGYARVCGSVRLVFSSRIKSYHHWQSAESNLRKSRSAHEKAKKSSRTHSEMLGVSLSEISEAERKALDAKQDFEDVGKLVKAEMTRFDKEKVEDFKKAVDIYAQGLVKRQREVVTVWQDYLDVLTAASS